MSGKMLDPLLPNDFITVGKNVHLEHNHPTLIGEIIKIKTTVEKIEDHKIYLDIEVSDAYGICCSGKYERTIINKNKLLEIAYHRI
jgi:predicted thioesterase